MSFGPTTDPRTQVQTVNATNVTISGQRLLIPGATGATVTSWGYGGQSTLDFYQNAYTGISSRARQTLFERIVDGGSGKLLVMIMEGFNDRNETDPSLGGTVDGDSPQAFVDNVVGLIDEVRADWADAVFNPDDPSFLTFSMYAVAEGNDELIDYADALMALAGSRTDVSFMALRTGQPTFAQADALGYYADGLHLSRDSELFYGEVIGDAIIPEAAAAVLWICAVGALVRSRPRGVRRLTGRCSLPRLMAHRLKVHGLAAAIASVE